VVQGALQSMGTPEKTNRAGGGVVNRLGGRKSEKGTMIHILEVAEFYGDRNLKGLQLEGRHDQKTSEVASDSWQECLLPGGMREQGNENWQLSGKTLPGRPVHVPRNRIMDNAEVLPKDPGNHRR